MTNLIPSGNDDRIIVIRKLKEIAISLSQMPGLRWISNILSTIADYVSAKLTYHQYVRINQKNYSAVIKALELGDGECRSCCNFCQRMHALLASDQRPVFVAGFLAMWACSPEMTIRFCAEAEREYIRQFMSIFRLT